jgi:hypothetical protein
LDFKSSYLQAMRGLYQPLVHPASFAGSEAEKLKTLRRCRRQQIDFK